MAFCYVLIYFWCWMFGTQGHWVKNDFLLCFDIYFCGEWLGYKVMQNIIMKALERYCDAQIDNVHTEAYYRLLVYRIKVFWIFNDVFKMYGCKVYSDWVWKTKWLLLCFDILWWWIPGIKGIVEYHYESHGKILWCSHKKCTLYKVLCLIDVFRMYGCIVYSDWVWKTKWLFVMFRYFFGGEWRD
jgi:hypothetical protein